MAVGGSVNGVRLALSFRNEAAIAANFRGADQVLVREVKAVVRNAGYLVVDFARALVPIDTSFMHDHVGVVFSPDGRVFEAGWDEADFDAAGLPFYPLYVEFGTSKMAAQPSLYPAYKEVQPIFLADLRDAVRASIDRAAARRQRRAPKRSKGRAAAARASRTRSR